MFHGSSPKDKCDLGVFVIECSGGIVCIVLYCIVLYCIVLYCIVLYCIACKCLSCDTSRGELGFRYRVKLGCVEYVEVRNRWNTRPISFEIFFCK